MTSELARVVTESRTVDVSPTVWAAAAFVGGLRTASNEEVRRQSQDRGAYNNAVVDLQGVVGELLALQLLDDALPAGWSVSHELLLWDGGGGAAASAGVDLLMWRAAEEAPVRRLNGSEHGTVALPERCLRLEA